MLMEFLNPIGCKTTPDQIGSILKCVQEKATGKPLECLTSSYTMEELVDVAARERKVLYQIGFFSDDLNSQLCDFLIQLEEKVKKLPRCLCHGDLSDKNLMQKESGEIIIIDWEDSFWGIDGYDYLYWLTFFQNRSFYRRENFNNLAYDNNTIKSVLAVILIIKSAISYYNGNYLRNSMTFEERITELLGVFGDN